MLKKNAGDGGLLGGLGKDPCNLKSIDHSHGRLPPPELKVYLCEYRANLMSD